MNKITLILAFCCVAAKVWSQQDPQYTQYMYNQAIINPAYAGSKAHASVVALYRDQWSGLEGAPKTITVSGHSPVGKKVGLGVSVISDQHGPVRENNIYADFSYAIQLSEKVKWAFGLKAGLTLHDIALSRVRTQVLNDPFFSQDVNQVTPNIGLGSFIYSNRFFIGLSMPNILNSVHLDEEGRKFGTEEQHYFISAGYVFQLSENIKFKPSTLVKSSLQSPLSFDLNTNFLFYDRFELGASYRYQDSFSGLAGFIISPRLRIGYAYDHILSDINIAARASHEIFIEFSLTLPQKVSRSPRFF